MLRCSSQSIRAQSIGLRGTQLTSSRIECSQVTLTSTLMQTKTRTLVSNFHRRQWTQITNLRKSPILLNRSRLPTTRTSNTNHPVSTQATAKTPVIQSSNPCLKSIWDPCSNNKPAIWSTMKHLNLRSPRRKVNSKTTSFSSQKPCHSKTERTYYHRLKRKPSVSRDSKGSNAS